MKNVITLALAFTAISSLGLWVNDNNKPDYRQQFTGEFEFTTLKYSGFDGQDTVLTYKKVETLPISFNQRDSVLVDLRPYAELQKYAAIRFGKDQVFAIDQKGEFLLDLPKGNTYESGRFVSRDKVVYQHWTKSRSGKLQGTTILAKRIKSRQDIP
jgi:hypothetical protein